MARSRPEGRFCRSRPGRSGLGDDQDGELVLEVGYQVLGLGAEVDWPRQEEHVHEAGEP